MASRAVASLAGLAIGDLLGGLCGREGEATLSASARDALAELAEGRRVVSANRACVSDDTILTLATLESISVMGSVCRADIETRFRRLDTRGGRQIELLKASVCDPYVATTGLTNGATLRAVPIAFFHGAQFIGDLLYDILKIGSLTHGHPNAIAASMMVGTIVAFAVDGKEASEIIERITDLSASIRRICGGGDLVFDNLAHALDALKGRMLAAGADALEAGLGQSVSASSSVVTGLALGLVHTDFPTALPSLLSRRRHGWDLDSTAAVYGAVAGALNPTAVPGDLVDQVEADTTCDFRMTVDRLFLHRQVVRSHLFGTVTASV